MKPEILDFRALPMLRFFDCLRGRQREDFCFEIAFAGYGEEADGNGQVEAAGAAGAGVEVEDAAFVGDAGDVGVAVDDGGEFCGCGVEVEGV